MKTIYSVKNGEYYTSELSEDGKELLKTEYHLEVKNVESHFTDDLLADWLDSWDYSSIKSPEIHNITWAQIYSVLEDNKCDMDIENYIRIACPYLPFTHYFHIPTGKLF